MNRTCSDTPAAAEGGFPYPHRTLDLVDGDKPQRVRSTIIGSRAQAKLNEGIIYAALVGAARTGKACPSNSDLRLLIGATSVSTPAHTVARMEKAGKLRVTHEGNGRQIYIVEIGVTITSKTWSSTRTREQETAQFERTMARLTPPPAPVYRDPCFRCGVRGDIGCEHAPAGML
jgi:hypothetical protein